MSKYPNYYVHEDVQETAKQIAKKAGMSPSELVCKLITFLGTLIKEEI